MDSSSCVSFTCGNHHLDIIYDRIEERLHFNKCLVNKNKKFLIKDVWVNDQPAKYLRNFQITLINKSDLSHFSLTGEEIFLYFISSCKDSIEIIDETKNIPEHNVLPRKINLDLALLDVKGLKKILKITSDKSLFDKKGYRLPNGYTLKELCIKPNTQLVIKNYICTEEENSDEDSLDELQTNEVIQPDINPKLPKLRLTEFTFGLNIMAKCQNPTCKAVDQNMCIQKKFGVFDITKVCQEAVCFCCKGKLSDINRIFLNGCNYTATGTNKEGEIRHHLLEGVDWNNTLTLFDNLSEMTSKWKSLTVTVEELPIQKPAFPIGLQWIIGGSVILVAAYVFFNMKKNIK